MHDRNGKFGKKKRNATRSGCTQTESLLRVAIGAECTFPQLKTQHGTWRDCLALLGHVMYFYFTGGLFFFFVYAARGEASEKRAVRNGLPHTLSLKNAKRGENVCVCCVVVLVA